nr:MAG TPA: hypothetical protein [Caudoviricetes sp.]
MGTNCIASCNWYAANVSKHTNKLFGQGHDKTKGNMYN